MSKRATSPSSSLIKRARTDDGPDPMLQQIVVASDGNDANKNALIQTIRRTSGLTAPIMCLQGHSKEILDLKFSPDGQTLASASADKSIMLWKVYGDCKNYGIIKMSKGAPTSIAFLNDTTLVAASTDHTIFLYNLKSGDSLRRFKGHRGIINSVDVLIGGSASGLIVSGSDDGTVRVWSENSKEEVEIVELGYPITAVKWSADGQQIYIGGIDNDIHVFSLAAHAISYTLRGHTDTITSLSLSPATSHLLSTAMDSTLLTWNIAPFAPSINPLNPTIHPRLIKSYFGAPAGFEGLLRKGSWSEHSTAEGSGGSMVAVGGADRALTIWDTETGEIKYKLPGHTGTVIASAWSPKEPIVASGGVEGVIYLGEVIA